MKNDATLRVRMPAALKTDLTRVAHWNGVKPSELSRDILAEWIKQMTGHRYEPPGLADMKVPPAEKAKL